jgi:membrane protein implicated in regulation of membrane protease activity
VKAPEERFARGVGAVLCLLLASVFVGIAVWLATTISFVPVEGRGLVALPSRINIPAIVLFLALALVAVVQAVRLLRERP